MNGNPPPRARCTVCNRSVMAGMTVVRGSDRQTFVYCLGCVVDLLKRESESPSRAINRARKD